MVFGTKIYSVYIKRGVDNPLETAMFIKQGFCLAAFLLTFVWALFNRLWAVALVITVISALLAYSNGVAFAVTSLLFSIWFGFEANNFKATKLEKKGYILFDTTTGADILAAQTRFYDKYLLVQQSSIRPAAS